MAKHPFLTERQRRLLSKGTGVGFEYEPFIRIQDISSRGTSSRIKGWKHGRQHDLLSGLEKAYFFQLEWADGVSDIREQFPLLPQTATQTLAKELGVKHPSYQGADTVMTTDFVISFNGKLFARSVKEAHEILDPRTAEKLDLERAFWVAKGVDWKLVTEDVARNALSENVEWVHEDYWTNYPQTEFEALEDHVVSSLEKDSLRAACLRTDHQLHLPTGSALSFVKHLIARKVWLVDMTIPINPDDFLQIHRNHANFNQLPLQAI